MKTIIAGSRYIEDYYIVAKGIQDSGFNITEVVSGGTRGIDTLGEQWARKNNIFVTRFIPDWNLHGKAAGPIRNSKMAKYADALIAFPLNDSRGTKSMIEQAKKYNLKVYIVNIG